ncbi:MAG: hypothetical protein ACRDTU_22090 [Micromonosporaceae bacterium]
MAETCLSRSEVYLGYMTATQSTVMQLTRARAALTQVPDVRLVSAQATSFRSPGTNRLRREVASIGDGIAAATDRVDELIAYLEGLHAKYEALWLKAVVREAELADK